MTRRLGLLIVCAALNATAASAQQLKGNTPTLVNCSNKPCFRVDVYAESNDEPIPLTADKGKFRVHMEGLDQPKDFTPFFIAGADGKKGSAAPDRENYLMLLLDMSGSMRARMGSTTRFEAARNAIRSVIGEMQEGVDYFALAPFESHHVRESVRAATFETSVAAARRRLETLTLPPISNNTALYTAMEEALGVLKQHEGEGRQLMLVVFTDGKNDVKPQKGDDAGLLGDEGLERVQALARSSNVEIVTIGFGTRGDRDFDENVLRILARPESKYQYAANGAVLSQLLVHAKKNLSTRDPVRLTFGPVAQLKSELSGKPLTFIASTTMDGRPLVSDPLVWSPPGMVEPSFEGHALGKEELSAYVSSTGKGDLTPRLGSNPWVNRLATLGIFSVLLSLGWFGLPRMLWPERYIPKPNFPMPPGMYQGGTPPSMASMPPRPRPNVPNMPTSRIQRPPIPTPGGDVPPANRPPRPPSPAPPRGRGVPPPRDPGDSTIYIPRGKKYEKDS